MARLSKSILTAFAWQGTGYLIPLFVTPYLSRTLGVSQFGLLGVAASMTTCACIVADWGFNLSATRAVARASHDPLQLRQIFWDTILAKFILAVLASISLFLVIRFGRRFDGIGAIVLAFSLQIFAGAINPGWFLQGLEQINRLATTSLVGRLLAVPLTFLFVKTPADAVIAAAIQGSCALLTTALCLRIASRHVKLWPIRIEWSGAVIQIREGAQLFISTAGIGLYTQANVLVLGFVSGPVQAGLYSGADRIRRAVQSLIDPVSTAIYPRMSHLIAHRPSEALRLMRWLILGQGAGTLALSLLMFGIAGIITPLWLGPEFSKAVPIVQWLSALPFVIGLNNAAGINIMLPLGLKSEFTYITVIAGLLNIALLFPLCRLYGGIGAAVAVVVTEVLVTLAEVGVLYANRDKVLGLGNANSGGSH